MYGQTDFILRFVILHRYKNVNRNDISDAVLIGWSAYVIKKKISYNEGQMTVVKT